MKIYCTICSAKKKNECEEFPELKFPAIELYKSKRIKKIFNASLEDMIEFRILSGKHGLLKPESIIQCYNHPLSKKEAPILADKITTQLNTDNIKEITFFKEDPNLKKGWRPYIDCIRIACERANVKLVEEPIPLTIEEFHKLPDVIVDKEIFFARQFHITETLYMASYRKIPLDFLEENIKIVNIEHNCGMGSSRIDLLGLDAENNIVVLEIKTEKAKHEVIGQIQAYMVGMKERNPQQKIRGIVIANGFAESFDYSLKGSIFNITNIDLSAISDRLYEIHLKLGTSKSKILAEIMRSTSQDLESNLQKFIEQEETGQNQLLLSISDLSLILQTSSQHIATWLKENGFSNILNV